MHLSGQTDCGHAFAGGVRVSKRLTDAVCGGFPPLVWLLFRPEWKFNGVVALLITRPSGSMSSALAPVVERSIPSRSVIRHKKAQKAQKSQLCFCLVRGVG
jgi:hypothetical protein